jgi:hypothetical protein
MVRMLLIDPFYWRGSYCEGQVVPSLKPMVAIEQIALVMSSVLPKNRLSIDGPTPYSRFLEDAAGIVSESSTKTVNTGSFSPVCN